MSSDSASDLARSLGLFARTLRSLIDGQDLPRPGSPADTETADEPYAHAWGDHPARDIYASVLLQAWSCADHLLAASELIASRSVSASPYTVIRAAAEAAAIACYITEDEIDPLERIRRNMNYRLEGLSQQIVMMTSFTVAGAGESVAAKEARLKVIAESGQQYGFRFRPRDGYKSAFFREKMPSAMQLIDRCASHTPGLGVTYQRYLSSVAHGQLHGLMRFAMNPVTLLEPEGPRTVRQLGVTVENLAQDLLIGPVCAATLLEHLGWFAGWDIDDQKALAVRMLRTWGRIAGLPYPGPPVSSRSAAAG